MVNKRNAQKLQYINELFEMQENLDIETFEALTKDDVNNRQNEKCHNKY